MNEIDYVSGLNACRDLLLNETREIQKIYVQQNKKNPLIGEIIRIGKSKQIQIQFVPFPKMEKLSCDEHHQGVVLEVSRKKYKSVKEILDLARQRGEPPLILILDRVQDPRNLGAVLRSALAAGVHGVVIPRQGAVSVNATVARVAEGALENLALARVPNIISEINYLEQQKVKVIATLPGTAHFYYEVDLKGPLAFVIGGEEEGIASEILERCHERVALPMQAGINSLNLSVVAGVILFEALRQRRSVF